MKQWKKYERLVALICSEDFSGTDMTVIPNARIAGELSGTSRQVDVLIDHRFSYNRERRVIVDAKKYKRKINVKDVEEFEGMMRDCGASKGILVCPEGYSEAAHKRSQESITIKIVTIDELENIDLKHWDDCYSDDCGKNGHRGLVLWDTNLGLTHSDGLISIFCVGKCDVCRRFQIWCWDCGQRFSLDDEDEHKCGCDAGRFWFTAIEEDHDDNTGDTQKAVYLLLPGIRDVLVVDRKSLR